MFARLPRHFGRVDVDGEESRVKQTKPKSNDGHRTWSCGMWKACRQKSSPETVLNKVQANKEEERVNRELEPTTKERNELTDRLLYVTGGSMKKRPNPFYEKLKITVYELMSLLHNLDIKNIEHHEKIQELNKEINFYRNLHSWLLMDQACMKKKLVTLKQESKEVQRYLFELNPNDEDEQEKTSNLQTQQNLVSETAGEMA
ncbi:disks large homolog 5-like [Rattus norvegicus]|uniref:disks large homolog 5-like n=1 Tax=Rattus norvegicus TaxID=10116 RepID=UPI0008101BF2|nr:disks large homolog 5-like isoform X5 [Rattus norvegicus]|eukprot:XP_006255424.3 PREDICTED: disks large homolog 5-like [Rattus norvegicus]